jgi:iron complex transport system substrate-binding protein
MKKLIPYLVFLLSALCSPSWALRIVSLLPSNTEILVSLGAGPEVVGVTRFDALLPQVGPAGDIGDFMHPNMERIVSLKPDLIVAGFWTSSHIIPRLQKMGYPVVQIRNPQSIEGIYQTIRDLAKAVNRPAAAQAVIAGMQAQFKKVRERGDRLPRRLKIYIEIDSPYWTIGGRDYLNEAMTLAGVDNIFADLPRPSAQVSPELIVERNPDVIVVFYSNREEVASREGWEGVQAIKNGFIIDDFSQDILSRPSPGLAAGMEAFVERMERLGKP